MTRSQLGNNCFNDAWKDMVGLVWGPKDTFYQQLLFAKHLWIGQRHIDELLRGFRFKIGDKLNE